MATVIIGGGIIGLSTAYYLSKSSRDAIHIIDSAPELLMSASAYAGGFLASDWFAPEIHPLGALSFRLHRELAEQNNGQKRWGFAGSHAYNLVDKPSLPGKDGQPLQGVEWLLAGTSRAVVVARNAAKANSIDRFGIGPGVRLNPDGTPVWITPREGGMIDTISGPEACGQLHPREFCEFLITECRARGVQIHLSTQVKELIKNNNNVIRGVVIEKNYLGRLINQSMECRHILLAAGPWTPRVFANLFPQSRMTIPIDPLAGYSITAKSPRYTKPFPNPTKRDASHSSSKDEWISYAVYCGACRLFSCSPEAYARLASNGDPEIWVGGVNDKTLQLPESAPEVKAMLSPEKIAELHEILVHMIGLKDRHQETPKDDLETVREALCFRPVSRTGKPFICEINNEDLGGVGMSKGGVWIASGHGPWGIALSTGTGWCMSELIQGKKPSINLSPFGMHTGSASFKPRL